MERRKEGGEEEGGRRGGGREGGREAKEGESGMIKGRREGWKDSYGRKWLHL